MKKMFHKQNGMSHAGLTCGDAAIAAAVAAAEKAAAELCWEAFAALVMSPSARQEPDTVGYVRNKTPRTSRKMAIKGGCYPDECRGKDSRVAKECHRPKKGRNAGKRGYRYCA
jgi:hypothetical protein